MQPQTGSHGVGVELRLRDLVGPAGSDRPSYIQPKNDLVKYLQSIGVRFGADLNAYTGFDETVYILPIPTDTARLVDQAFTILEDWARGQVFDDCGADCGATDSTEPITLFGR